MKRKITQFVNAILFCVLLALSGCTNEATDKSVLAKELQISKAKSWFTDYKAGEVFYPVFTNINYHWENASIVILEDGSKAVTVPITDQNQNPDYKGEKILYLYPFEESYDAVVYELSPDQNQTSKREGFQKLESYNGYISTWDLRKGFIKGQKFANSTATEAVAFKIVTEEELKTHKLVPKAIELREVIIEGSRGGGGDELPYFYVSSYLGGSTGSYSVSGSNTDNYFNHGGGGKSSSTTPKNSCPTGYIYKFGECVLKYKIIDSLTGKAKCLNALLSKKGNTFVQDLLANFAGDSKFDIEIVSKDKVASSKNNIITEINGRTLPPVNKLITIEISTTRTDQHSALDATRTILHEYIHADIYRKISTIENDKSQEGLDFKKTYEAYERDQHSTMATLYLNSMKEALKAFHKNVLIDDYNKYTNYFEEVPSDAFYEALAWGGLKDNDVKAWNDLPADKKAAIEKLANRASLLSKTVPCP